MSVLPLIFGGGGLATALLGLLPNLRSYALIGLAVLLGLAVIYGQTEKANYESEKAARASDNAAADQAALQQAARDREWRAQIDAQHQADMADLQRKATTRETAIRNAPASAGPLPPCLSRLLRQRAGRAASPSGRWSLGPTPASSTTNSDAPTSRRCPTRSIPTTMPARSGTARCGTLARNAGWPSATG